MADRGDTHYSVASLNTWFALSSLALLAALVWMMIDDWNRPWKDYQREWRGVQTARAAAEQERLSAQGALDRERQLLEQLEGAQAQIRAREKELAEANEAVRLARGNLWSAQEASKKEKSKYNWERFLIETQRIARNDPGFRKAELDAIEAEMNARVTAQEQADLAFQAAQARAEELQSAESEAQRALAAGTRELAMVRKRLEDLAPSDRAAKVANVIRDAPGLDFIGPSLVVNKVVLERLTFELNFTKKKRIDMCHTCHLGIDQAGYEGEAQPFTSHPRLDLYLDTRSPHPMKDFGCSICHRGSGEALDFVRADHRPDSKAQADAWHEELGWHKQHHWDYPMLQSSMTEASCVQCHKTSMELIADAAPKVSEGYRLAEKYGCYACHKIDWFPTKRRPGPSLLQMQSKLTPEFIASWIAAPRSFRPTTWMPQFFHLENYKDSEPVVVSRYGQGRPILGHEWEEAAIAATTAFLLDRAPRQPLPPVPVEGDAHRGREVMRLSGCLACHNVAPHEGEPKARDFALEEHGTNEHGPNLRGVATKLNREWLYAWVKDPTKYWPDTRMPNLRLSDQDAADIVAYMLDDPDGIFHDVPEGWTTERPELPREQLQEVLAEQARWYFARDGRTSVEARLTGQDPKARWDEVDKLLVAVGEKVVSQYGCFSCHEIQGMQDMMPIGTELSSWGSKTVDKLDFGFGEQLFGLDHSYREGWLMQKLHAPRSFDQQKVKNPTERLRMPWFGFDQEQVHALTTFVVGLVDDEVQRAKMVPSAPKLAMDTGMRVVRQKNCLACHMVEPGTATFVAEDGRTHTISAELLPIGEAKLPPPHHLAGLDADLEAEEVTEVGLRALRPEPDLGLRVGDRLFVERDKLSALGAPRGGEFVRAVADYYYYGIELHDPQAASEEEALSYVSAAQGEEFGVQDVDGVIRDHSAEPFDKIRWTFAPPVLWNEGGKVRPGWFHAFLGDVTPLRGQLRVRMPSFHFDAGEAAAVADYFAHKSAAEWPASYARQLRLLKGMSAAEVAQAAGLTPEAVLGIEAGRAADISASFQKLRAWGSQQEGWIAGPINPDYEVIPSRNAAYLKQRAEQVPGHMQIAQGIAEKAVNCYQCHFRLDQPPAADPIAWAPDLSRVHERLRQDWVQVWLEDPGRVYPGTAMPANFTSDPPQYQDIFPGSTNAEQVRVVLDWLYNFDRVMMGAGASQ